jgi:hypothetical protein
VVDGAASMATAARLAASLSAASARTKTLSAHDAYRGGAAPLKEADGCAFAGRSWRTMAERSPPGACIGRSSGRAASARDGSQTGLRAAFAKPSVAARVRASVDSTVQRLGRVDSSYAASTARPALHLAIPHEAETRETEQHHSLWRFVPVRQRPVDDRYLRTPDSRSRREADVADRGLGRLSWADSGPTRRHQGRHALPPIPALRPDGRFPVQQGQTAAAAAAGPVPRSEHPRHS